MSLTPYVTVMGPTDRVTAAGGLILVSMEFFVRRATPEDKAAWFRMRQLLWSDTPVDALDYDLDEILNDPGQAVFIASLPDGRRIGFLEASLRDQAESCETSPVGYIEGWFVEEGLRDKGIGASLVRASEEWARGLGATEMASDTWLENDEAIRVHRRLGYEETERLVHFVKRLT